MVGRPCIYVNKKEKDVCEHEGMWMSYLRVRLITNNQQGRGHLTFTFKYELL